MPQRIQKNKRAVCALLITVMVALGALFFLSSPSHAYTFQNPTVLTATNDICPGTPGFATRIIVCVKESLLYAVNSFIDPFSRKLRDFVRAACVLALAIWGGLMALGKQSAPVKDASVMLIKIGAVVLFTTNFGGMFPLFLDTIEWMLSLVTRYAIYSPSFNCPLATAVSGTSMEVWALVDCSLDALVGGIFTPINLALGISGFLVAMLFSQAIGLFVGLIGFLIIGQLLWAIIRGVYIFLSSYIAFSLMVIISPLFIPLILFQATKGYFEKWLRITMGFMLQPIFLFAYLAMLIAAYDVVVYTGPHSLYHIIAGNAANDPNFKIGAWAYSNGIYGESSQSSKAYNVNPKRTLSIPLQDTNVGIIGEGRNQAQLDVKLTEQITNPSEWIKANGLPRDILSNKLGPLGYFRVDLPVNAIDWESFAAIHGHDPNSPTDMTNFWTDLLLSCIMALLISYIFLLMLDLLPFIGSGIAGDVLSMPAFGAGAFTPPGDGAVKGMLMGNVTGSK